MVNRAIKHHYKRFRAHQLETYGNSNLWVDGRNVRQFTGGSAPYGEHAISAYLSAKRHIHFMENLKRSLTK